MEKIMGKSEECIKLHEYVKQYKNVKAAADDAHYNIHTLNAWLSSSRKVPAHALRIYELLKQLDMMGKYVFPDSPHKLISGDRVEVTDPVSVRMIGRNQNGDMQEEVVTVSGTKPVQLKKKWMGFGIPLIGKYINKGKRK